MNILAFDTSTPSGGVALMRAGRLSGVACLNTARRHSAECLDLAMRLLDAEGMAPGDVDVFGVARGPGSFTGVRIAMTLAKTLAWSLGKPLATVCTMRAMAANASSGEQAEATLVLLDARRGELYAALYGGGAEGWRTELVAPFACPPGALRARLGPALRGRILACGEGAILTTTFPSDVEPWGGVVLARVDRRFASPATVALLAHEAALRGEFTDPAAAVPVYLREPLEKP